MAETTSTMLPLGTVAPDFELMDTLSGQKISVRHETAPIATVNMFICNHCPYVKLIQEKLVAIAKLNKRNLLEIELW